jgi:hypothetical protein
VGITLKQFKRFNGKQPTKFRAKIDKFTSILFYQRDANIYCVIKKDLLDYETSVSASEFPISVEFLKTPDAHETTLADINIFEKEIMPITVGISQIFGEDKILSLDAVRLAVGSNENDYITVDETDLAAMDVEPSLQGLLDFIKGHREGIIGFCDRSFQPERFNVIFFESKLRNPDKNIKSIQITILSSLQQRGLYMQEHHRYNGLQLYVTIKFDEIDDQFLDFLKSIEIDWEILFLRRDLALDDWTEIECERNSINLKGYIKVKYETLGFFDINNITRLVVRNQLDFKIADKIADILNKSKLLREEGLIPGTPDKKEPLSKAEIAAAAQLACAYFQHKVELKLDKDVLPDEVHRYQQELIKL